ncbi:MAG TPA: helix-turn-helix domain-containing protein [Syntrophales bacterium]|nr:helix-turn-helix domain-containing protein [Syntrophales bacterium]
MEKISIVRRRKNDSSETNEEKQGEGSRLYHNRELMEIPASVLSQGKLIEKKSRSVETSGTDIDESISINLTQEQYDLVKSNRYVKYFLNGDGTGVSLDVGRHAEGQIIFNFQFKKVDVVKMLKAKHVCQMLDISNSMLMNLVKSKKIRSYKVGRLRRFLLQDVLDYLSKGEEVSGYSGS